MNKTENGFQYDATHTPSAWWSAEVEPSGEWQPILRNGGPRSGYRLGTAYPVADGGEWEFTFGRDEHGNLLPGFSPEVVDQ